MTKFALTVVLFSMLSSGAHADCRGAYHGAFKNEGASYYVDRMMMGLVGNAGLGSGALLMAVAGSPVSAGLSIGAATTGTGAVSTTTQRSMDDLVLGYDVVTQADLGDGLELRAMHEEIAADMSFEDFVAEVNYLKDQGVLCASDSLYYSEIVDIFNAK